MIIECVNCKSIESKFVDEYKFHVESDSNYLGNMKIYLCESCKICFAHPKPSINQINFYYNKIYRAKKRPHNYANVTQLIRDTHFSIINLITQKIDIQTIKKVYEIGPGFGQLGQLLKLSGVNEIYSEEIDKNLFPYLNKNYKNGISDEINLVLSIHSLEHFTNINDFFSLFEKKLASKSYILIEVPNNEYKKWFSRRAYDSPHLIFFSKKGLENILIERGYDIIFSSYTGIKLEEHFKNMNNSLNIYFKWPKIKINYTLLTNLKIFVKNILPFFVINIFRKIKNKSNALNSNDFLIDNLVYGKSDRSNIRILARKF